MENPHAHIISRFVGWEWFGSLSFKGKEVPSQTKRRKMWFAYLYEVAARADVPFSSLFWVLRSEKGGKTERDHYHFLLGNSHLKSTIGNAHTLRWLWRKSGGGISVVTAWDPSLAGVDYVTKALGVGRAAGNLYELERFRVREHVEAGKVRSDRDDVLEFSKSFESWLDRRARSISEIVPSQTDGTSGANFRGDGPRSDQDTLAYGLEKTPF